MPNRKRLPPNVIPFDAYTEVRRLSKKLNLSAGDCLGLLAEALADLDRQITEHDEGDGLPFPPLWLADEVPRDPAA